MYFNIIRSLLLIFLFNILIPLSSQPYNNSVLSEGIWYKVKIASDGIYKLTYSQLKELGVKYPENIRIYGNGGTMLPKSTSAIVPNDLQENAVYFVNGNYGKFNDGDYVLFYGKGTNSWEFVNNHFFHKKHKFSDVTYYYLTESFGKGKQITLNSYSENYSYSSNTFDDFAYHEIDSMNLFKSGAELYGERFENGSKLKISFSFPNISVQDSVFFYYSVIARAPEMTNFQINVGTEKIVAQLNGVDLNSKNGVFATENMNSILFPYSLNKIDADLIFNSYNSVSYGQLNYLGFNVRRNLIFTGETLHFRDKNTIGTNTVTKYSISNINSNTQVWDITDLANIKQVNLNNDGSFISSSDGLLKQFVAFDINSKLPSPTYKKTDDKTLGIVENQNIHGSETPEFVIVSPTDTGILNQAKRLAKYREDIDKIKTLVVTIEQVYNEFSSGTKDITAIRNMAKMFYDRDTLNTFKYLLLFGDGTFMNKRNCKGNTNLIPTYQSENSLIQVSSYVTDDYFGWLKNKTDDSMDTLYIGVGRLPLDNAEQAKDVVDKIIGYNSIKSVGDWRNNICFIGDDEDNNIHLEGCETISNDISKKFPNYRIQKIYLDAFPELSSSVGNRYPDVNNAINTVVNKGALIINYIGHANEGQLAHEEILTKSMIRNWKNINTLPLFITATCEFSRFDDFNQETCSELTAAGEEIIMHPSGGAIALLTTTRLVYSGENETLNRTFYKYAFNKLPDNKYPRLGDAFKLTKNDVGKSVNKLNFTLLGDPSMTLAYPKNLSIITDSINNKWVTREADTIIYPKDTIKALSFASVSGHVEDENGNLKNDFNEVIYISILDKSETKSTLGNNKNTATTYKAQENTIYRGPVKAQDGKFSFSFPIPKDIKYDFGNGKIVYYAFDSQQDIAGYSTQLIIGGLTKNPANDNEGPVVEAFMNDTFFINGSTTNSNPKLLVKLFDENGINATGAGVGHDITVVIDNDFTQMFSINEFYSSELNDFRRGSALYPLYNIKPGKHSIKVIAWDIYNNSAETEVDFVVNGSTNMKLLAVRNYPNPFSTSTTIIFEHNWAEEEIEAELRIYNFSGQLVRLLYNKGIPAGFNTPAFNWDGTNQNGSKLNNGIYPYRLIIKSKTGKQAESGGKMLLTR